MLGDLLPCLAGHSTVHSITSGCCFLPFFLIFLSPSHYPFPFSRAFDVRGMALSLLTPPAPHMQPFSPIPLKITYPTSSPATRTLAPSFSSPVTQAHLDTLPNAEAGPSRLGGDLGAPSSPARSATPRIILRVNQPIPSPGECAQYGWRGDA
jgi:hypothetical protein